MAKSEQLKTGDRLPNAATVLLVEGFIILAVQESPEPFVTWRWNGIDPASTYYGNYFRSISAAALDFEARVELEARRERHG